MPGGLMSLVSEGQANILLNGNPSKSFFKSSYLKYTNFGLQKFRLDFEGSKTLQLSEDSYFTFKVLRYADLLMDCYISVDLPNIWSPIMPPSTLNGNNWVPYEFKWIDNLGAKMIRKIEITCGNQKLQEFSGDYLLSAVQRDFSGEKRALFDKMIGNVAEVNDPANFGSRVNAYPNAYYTSNNAGADPSIRGRTLYIPLNAWFNLKSQMAFPLTALQYNELHINITFRPIQELFRIRDVFDYTNNFPYISPNFNQYYMQFYRFLQTPPDLELGYGSYADVRTLWNSDINLRCTYGFLSNNESRVFSLNEQKYIFKQVYETWYYNVTGTQKLELNSLGMTIDYMWYFQRSDVNLRNEWSNYSNWAYDWMPNDIIPAPTSGLYPVIRNGSTVDIGPGVEIDGTLTGFYITPIYNIENTKDIMITAALLLDGIYREDTQPVGVFNYIEKYLRTSGNGIDGLYLYNFCLHTDPFDLQPSGMMNMSRFTKIELETVTITPPLNPLAQTLNICDPATGNIIGVNKNNWQIYQYNFNVLVMEERVNFITFVGGNAALAYAT